MRIILCSFLICTVFICFSQEREFPDYRSKKETFLRMQEKDVRADLASFTMGGMDESIGKGKLKSISASDLGPDHISFAGNNLSVTIKSGDFVPLKHKLTYYNKHLIKIDNKPYFGNYGEVPSKTIAGVIVLIDKDTVPIPLEAFLDLYNPVFTYTDASGELKSYNSVFLSRDNHKIYIYMLNLDKQGSYEVTWVIQDKKYLRRVVDFGFMK